MNLEGHTHKKRIMGGLAVLPPALIVAILVLANGCGSGAARQLKSISVTPASADAQTFPNGQVQFTALGNYTEPPSQSEITASWSVMETNLATISQSGVGQCVAGASGLATVKASTPAPCSGTGCTAALLSATAQLTCP